MGMQEYSVCQFFAGHTGQEPEWVRWNVSADEAVKAACHYTTSVAARFGFVDRVIITDGLDCLVFDWRKGVGIIWPEKLK
jgi:hypothetical protein